MKREDEKKELRRDSWWEDHVVFEKVLFERSDEKKPFVIFHLQNGDKVKQEVFGDKDAATAAFGGGGGAV